MLSKKLFLFSICAVIRLKTEPLFVGRGEGDVSAQMCANRPGLPSPVFPVLAQKPGTFTSLELVSLGLCELARGSSDERDIQPARNAGKKFLLPSVNQTRELGIFSDPVRKG